MVVSDWGQRLFSLFMVVSERDAGHFLCLWLIVMGTQVNIFVYGC